ncbi:MAG TPA: hypothetical protein VNL94_06740 [Candidatus Binatia bacterium]|nr:hypothetical protein [Candidatus Binatia bacterium]
MAEAARKIDQAPDETRTVEVLPEPTSVLAAMEQAAGEKKAAQSRARREAGTATTGAKPKAAKAPAKPAAKAKAAAPKPKAAIDRVPAAEVVALIEELKITRSQLAAATGKSPSLVSEWVGKGRGHLVARSEWKAIEAAARKFAKGLK